jgi:hypothetical protein
MALLEDRTAVFIVRVWCERGEAESSTTPTLSEWRGSVEHVQSGQRAFFRHLDAVCEFMKPHLQGIGIDAQQRFWERISSAIDDVAMTHEAQPVSLTLPLGSMSSPTLQRSGKRR